MRTNKTKTKTTNTSNDYGKVTALLGSVTWTVVSAFDKAVVAERDALLASFTRKTRSTNAACYERARQFYAEEVLAELARPTKLRPDDVLSYRRRATVWAVAAKIREELSKQERRGIIERFEADCATHFELDAAARKHAAAYIQGFTRG